MLTQERKYEDKGRYKRTKIIQIPKLGLSLHPLLHNHTAKLSCRGATNVKEVERGASIPDKWTCQAVINVTDHKKAAAWGREEHERRAETCVPSCFALMAGVRHRMS